jgi:hypothetical protein
MTTDHDASTPDDPPATEPAVPRRLDPTGGVGIDPYSPEGLRQAQQDRLEIMGAFGLDEDDFGDATIWLTDDSDDEAG